MKHLIGLGCIMLLGFGCAPSLVPIGLDKDAVLVPEVLGTWQDKGEELTFAVEQGADASYLIKFTDKAGRDFELTAHFFKIGDALFLDTLLKSYPSDKSLNISGFTLVHLATVHNFAKVIQTTPSIRLAPVNSGWLKDYLTRHPRALRHVIPDPEGIYIILTDTTKNVNKFLRMCVKKYPEAFAADDPIELSRP